MSAELPENDPQRILRFWWMTELFSPQGIPKLTSRSARAADRQVIEWKPDSPLPWETLRSPEPLGRTQRVWEHTVYLGVYDLESTYDSLHRAFNDDNDAYDARPAGRSACAGMVVNNSGQLVAGSAVLSSALWAVGRISKHGVGDGAWADGFPDSAASLLEVMEEHEGRRCETAGTEKPPAQDGDSLPALMRIAQRIAGVVGDPRLATETIVIQSMAVSAQRADGTGDTDFLNSFFLDDLAAVQSALASGQGSGDALSSYLMSDGALKRCDRVDVLRTREAADNGVTVKRLPKGRWPSDPTRSLSLRQQFAVNYALNDLAPTPGLMGVNGPPGTGKTTMLRDILAGNVVERARRLAALGRPEDAFTSTTHRWTAEDGHRRSVKQLRPELTGYEMVVVSANNAAVENVTTEIPARDAIDPPWQGGADYFADIATELLTEVSTQKNDAARIDAWGLIAARLGNKRNRSAFHSAFWFDKKNPRTNEALSDSPPRMQTRLTQWRDGIVPHKTWDEARLDFARAQQRVDELITQRQQMQERLEELPQMIEAERTCVERVARLQHDLRAMKERLLDGRNALELASKESSFAAAVRDRHVDARPGVVETVFTLGRVIREWRADLRPLDDHLRIAETNQHKAEARIREWEGHTVELERECFEAEAARAHASELLNTCRRRIHADKSELGRAYPDDAWTGEARELHAPWLDAELNVRRSDLFLAALQLHQDFLANTAAEMLHGLRAALEIVSGGGPRMLEAVKRRAAWQLFFLVVPLVSTTFASFGRMFGDIGSESIGWLLIDEAGQASPQYAAGAIWRARRVVVVGDPLQLQPVVTIPRKVQRDIASTFGISDSWIPPHASVQTLADRVSLHGTTLQRDDQDVWVSAPLTVHRRCDDPMFTLCNDIAYNGMMVNGLERRLDDPSAPDTFDSLSGPLIVPSHWVDEPALTPGSHLQENQIDRFEKALAYLKDYGVPPEQVIAISPFRAVANRLETLSRTYPGLTAGTIHTAQGREASVVILVLGGDPGSPGAKAWAASSVNLVNVAASRAKRRLYVIGDLAAWSKHKYFHELALSLGR